jgi:MFS family permease
MTKLERHGWVVVGVLSIALFLLMGTAFDLFGIFLLPLQQHFGWDRAQSSLLFTAMAPLYAANMPVAGWLLDRFDARFVMATGAESCGIGFVCASLSNSYASIMAAYVLIGIGIGLAAYMPVTVVVTNWFDRRRGLALGIARISAASCLSSTAIRFFRHRMTLAASCAQTGRRCFLRCRASRK